MTTSRQLSWVEKCQQAGHPSHHLAQYRMRNGSIHYCAWCPNCDRNVTRDVDPKKRTYFARDTTLEWCKRKNIDPESLPLYPQGALLRVCYACGEIDFCEDDHVAERTIHGDFAERLPVVPLCTKCHRLKTNNLQEFMRRLRGGPGGAAA